MWQAEHQNAFDKVKQVLTSEPVLKLYRRDREHVLQTDACHEQIAATLLQREEDGDFTQLCMPVGSCYPERSNMLSQTRKG